MEQVPFGDMTFADNPEPRCACVLLLDVSSSMRGDAIRELNEGLIAYQDELAADSLAAKRVDVAVVTFGGDVKTETEFTTADYLIPPALVASGDTPMGAAIEHAIELLTKRKALYRENGIAMYRPWIFLITDGEPTDSYKKAAQAVREGVASRSFVFFAVGVEGANFKVLREISVTEPMKLKGTQFRELFSWLSQSQKQVAGSKLGDAITPSNPTAEGGWGSIPT